MSITAQMHIAICEAKHVIDHNGKTLREKLQLAMNTTKHHYMLTNEDERLRSAIAATMLHYGMQSEEYKRLEQEVVLVKKLGAAINAMQAGLTVDFSESMTPADGFVPIGVMKMWHETT